MEPTNKYQYKPSDTTKLFQKLSIILYLCGFVDFWIEDVKLPAKFVRLYNSFRIFIELLMFSFMVLEVGAFFTQNNLTEKQSADRLVYGISHPILYIYCLNLLYYKKEIREVLYRLAASLKDVYNDEEVEKHMLRKLKFYLMAYVTSCGSCMVFYGASAWIQYIRLGSPFTTVITAWPDTLDESHQAHIFRVLFYLIWWIYFTRVSASYILILSMFISLSFQYTNLQSYFSGLKRIFDSPLEQRDKEAQFLSAFETGVRLHLDTIWCKQECQRIYNIIFSAQLLQTVAELVSVMSMMINSERTVVNLGAVMSTTCGALISTGFLMWNAGDVTVEASYLPAAIYCSGWQNVRHASLQSRHLVIMAITQAQRPVVFTALGFVPISYETYLKIAKISYSVFSVVY
uniref:Odorant receptor n=1 Tax=Semiothisa cinerearia TaxID=2249628 RepID=A0A889XLC5_9NEOP|nr:odorant receptor [Semiothisa cinerearia]